MRKTLLAFGSLLAFSAPILTVVACGGVADSYKLKSMQHDWWNVVYLKGVFGNDTDDVDIDETKENVQHKDYFDASTNMEKAKVLYDLAREASWEFEPTIGAEVTVTFLHTTDANLNLEITFLVIYKREDETQADFKAREEVEIVKFDNTSVVVLVDSWVNNKPTKAPTNT